jgi:hypothetical protein
MGSLLILLLVSMQATCPDLSGKYVIQGEDGRVYFTISQLRCESIRIGHQMAVSRCMPNGNAHG